MLPLRTRLRSTTVVCLAIAAAYAAPPHQAKVAAAKTDLLSLVGVLRMFRLDCDRYPTTSEGLRALVKRPAGLKSWRGPYIKGKVPPDPWGRPYGYKRVGKGAVIWTLGSDGKLGGKGNAADQFERF